jgi:hypothetical protein
MTDDETVWISVEFDAMEPWARQQIAIVTNSKVHDFKEFIVNGAVFGFRFCVIPLKLMCCNFVSCSHVGEIRTWDSHQSANRDNR